jgi:hypothetical protein
MSLIYFEDHNGRSVAVVASKIASIHQNRLPTDAPVCIVTTSGCELNVRGSFDAATEKLMEALKGDV